MGSVPRKENIFFMVFESSLQGPNHEKKMVKIRHEDTELEKPLKKKGRPLTAPTTKRTHTQASTAEK